MLQLQRKQPANTGKNRTIKCEKVGGAALVVDGGS